jgi:hypothetical protein
MVSGWETPFLDGEDGFFNDFFLNSSVPKVLLQLNISNDRQQNAREGWKTDHLGE